ncbi:hypothetical protein [Actinomadura sp. HBU206391]|uniref:hypothetical protein n=1 Tax=Actinomadura sp. HBU206391 TaxID=2731692 RepID=UPI0016506E42|nr:hypothetical protein [Actinomadura sp. HBU206391]MBC6456370.1 hypothetical protein [Actinomadura sp. HBU206391]
MAESGLPALAFAIVDVLRRGAIDELWRTVDPQFRLALAQMWIWRNRDALDDELRAEGISQDNLAAELAEASPQHPLWAQCARVTLRTILQAVGDLDQELGSPADHDRSARASSWSSSARRTSFPSTRTGSPTSRPAWKPNASRSSCGSWTVSGCSPASATTC